MSDGNVVIKQDQSGIENVPARLKPVQDLTDINGTSFRLQDAGEYLLLRAEVGELPADGKSAILASAMEANFLYRGIGGATLAVNPDDGRLYIHKYNWMERLDADSVLDALDRLADTTAAWRSLISDCHPEVPAAAKAFSDGLDGHGLGESGFTQV